MANTASVKLDIWLGLVACCLLLSSPTHARNSPLGPLPGQPADVTLSQYTGFVALPPDAHTGTAGKQLFYWLVESEHRPDVAPLVLWSNGGPGCSSMIGLMSENGPFRVAPDGATLELRPERWNQHANMLYVDSPAGVGFSTYAPTYSDDNTTAFDMFNFLGLWLKEFPQYKNRAFFLTGESYAGHYLPSLAKKIVEGKNPDINLHGIMIGNPTTNLSTDFFFGTMRTYFYYGLISLPTWEGIQGNCWGHWLEPVPSCQKYLDRATQEMGRINPYDINVPVCNSAAPTATSPMTRLFDVLHHDRAAGSGIACASSATPPPWVPYYPCEDNYLTSYLNRADVKSIIGVNASVSWKQCANINYNYTNFYDSMLPIYEMFVKNPNPPAKVHIWIYSGTADTVVPYLGTQMWVNGLFDSPSDVVVPWHAWDINGTNGLQVAGYFTSYQSSNSPNRFSFITIKDAGHMVPQTKSVQGFTMFSSFLAGLPL